MSSSHRSLLLAALLFAPSLAIAACSAGAPASSSPPVDVSLKPIAPDDADTIPCAARRVLERICQRCHSDPPQNGAPFPLVTRSNIVRVGPDGDIRLAMIEQIEAGRMPLAPVTIDYDSREALLAWLHAGAPAQASGACDEPDAAEPRRSDARAAQECDAAIDADATITDD